MKLSAKEIETWSKARELFKSFHGTKALALYQGLAKKYPLHPHLLWEMGSAAKLSGDVALARDIFRKALRHGQQEPRLLLHLGREMRSMRMSREATECFQRVLQLDGKSIDGISEMVRWYEGLGQMNEAQALLDPLLQESRNLPVIRHLQAFLMLRRGEVEAAETILRDEIAAGLRDPKSFLANHYLLADLLDKSERYDEAMKFLQQAKQLAWQQAEVSRLVAEYDAGIPDRQRLLESFSRADIDAWQAEPMELAGLESRIAFLGGHPRSGTTLLERVLDSHPQLTAFDEPLAFYQTVDPFLRRFGPQHPDLGKQPARYKEHLLWEVDNQCDSKILLDKNPSLTACLHSWLRAFPGVKVIIALRQPMDVILSCYFLDTPINSLSCNFLSFERISKHYRDMMDVWLRLRELGGFSWIESRYEDVVKDLPTEGARVTEFLGLDWQPEQADFYQKKNVTPLLAPTYHDVTKPIYQRSMERWRRYESHLSPFIDELSPYLNALGYSA